MADSIIRLFDYSTISRRAFTLVEMLIVVAILAVLMTIAFRLGSIGGEDSRRTVTVVRMQKIENCLSGYYAAFGSYPPVKVHGYRDITCKVNENGDQEPSGGGSQNTAASGETLVWAQVNAACRSQPFGCEYPGDEEDNEYIKSWTSEIANRVGNPTDYPNYAPNKYAYANIFQGSSEISGPDASEGFNKAFGKNGTAEWKTVKLFKFGMMSFLLPRYLFMMGWNQVFSEGASYGIPVQWSDNNDIPCDPFEGESFAARENGESNADEGWREIQKYSQINATGNHDRNQLARVANIPSQAVCARWMPNLEHICRTLRDMTFFGVQINDPHQTGLGLDDDYPPDPGTHEPPGGGKPYKNAFVTILDGWANEFYYYSPPPYQSYTLWSAGANGKTFPPWMSLDALSPSELRDAVKWKSDDIMQMSH